VYTVSGRAMGSFFCMWWCASWLPCWWMCEGV
jgi:hypothetical protein